MRSPIQCPAGRLPRENATREFTLLPSPVPSRAACLPWDDGRGARETLPAARAGQCAIGAGAGAALSRACCCVFSASLQPYRTAFRMR